MQAHKQAHKQNPPPSSALVQHHALTRCYQRLTFSTMVILLLGLSACATMNKNECITADWRGVGYGQGASGKSAVGFEDFRKSCAKHGVTAQFEAFKQGHSEGLNDYCIFENGKSLGQKGQNINRNCSARQFPQFEEGYRAGIYQYCDYNTGYEAGIRGEPANQLCPGQTFASYAKGHMRGIQKYQLMVAIEDLEEEYDAMAAELDALDSDIDNAEVTLTAPGTTPLQRKNALDALKNDTAARDQLRRQYRRLEKSLHQKHKAYESL